MNRRSTYVAPHVAWRRMLGAGIGIVIAAAVAGGVVIALGPPSLGLGLLGAALTLVTAGAVIVRRLRGPAVG